MTTGGAVRAALAGAALGAGALGAWATLVERNAFAVRRVRFPVLDPGAQPIRVLHLSDLHLAPWQTGKMRWLRSLRGLEPDLIVDTGDNFGHEAALFGLRHVFDAFAGVPGVFVHGSNDYFRPIAKNPFAYFRESSRRVSHEPNLDTAGFERYVTDDLGWLNLNNSAGRLELRGTTVDVVGVNDPHRNFDRLDEAEAALDRVEQGAGAPAQLIVGVAHAPYARVLDALTELGADVLFAGHTHGGQVCLPGGRALVTNCDISPSQARGPSLWTHDRYAAHLNVSAGVGTSLFAPFRFACRPEASLVTLSPRSESHSG